LVKVVGFGLSSLALVVADSFLVWFRLPFFICSLVFAFAFALFGFGFGLHCWHCLFCRLGGLSGLFPFLSNTQFFAGFGVYLNRWQQRWAFLLLGGVFWHLCAAR